MAKIHRATKANPEQDSEELWLKSQGIQAQTMTFVGTRRVFSQTRSSKPCGERSTEVCCGNCADASRSQSNNPTQQAPAGQAIPLGTVRWFGHDHIGNRPVAGVFTRSTRAAGEKPFFRRGCKRSDSRQHHGISRVPYRPPGFRPSSRVLQFTHPSAADRMGES